MRFPNARSRRVATALFTSMMLVASTTACASTGPARFQTAAPPRPEVDTKIVYASATDVQHVGYVQPAALETLGLESPLFVGTAVAPEPVRPPAPHGPFAEQDAARFDIVVTGGRSFFSDPIQVGGAALVLALLASFVSGSSCPAMAESLGRCGR